MYGKSRQEESPQMSKPTENETPADNLSDEEKKKQEAERRRREFEEKLKQEQYQRDDM
jgi:hypothetical protein